MNEHKSKELWEKFNINDEIKVKLTGFGMDIYDHQFDDLNSFAGREVLKPSYLKMDEEGFTIFQLWDFMHIFGKYFCLGGSAIIEGNNIYFQERDLEEV